MENYICSEIIETIWNKICENLISLNAPVCICACKMSDSNLYTKVHGIFEYM